jgi:hypothetical protein
MMLPVPYPMSVVAVRFRYAAALLLMVIALVACAPPRVQMPPYPPPPYPSGPPGAVLDRLLADYRALGLPLPPAEARLVRWNPDGMIMGSDHRPHPVVYLAFEVPNTTDSPRHHLLVGTEHFIGTLRPYDGNIVPVEPTLAAAEGVRGSYDYPAEHGEGRFARYRVSSTALAELHSANAALATAIQAKARGWDALAERLLALASTERGDNAPCPEWPGMPLRQRLALLARVHFAMELDEPGADRAAIARRLTAAVAFDPTLPDCECSWFVRRFGLPMDICGRG